MLRCDGGGKRCRADIFWQNFGIQYQNTKHDEHTIRTMDWTPPRWLDVKIKTQKTPHLAFFRLPNLKQIRNEASKYAKPFPPASART